MEGELSDHFNIARANSNRVKKFIDTIGHERILFGSDIPFGTMKWELEKVLSLLIGDDKREWVPSKNLKRLIGLEEIEFIFQRNKFVSRMIAFDKIVKN